jgi:TonB-dependent starch-binding outer membrane protein SusC
MKRKLLAFLLLCLFAITSVMAQNKTITGKVVGADDGLPLPGVSVRVGSVGTTTGTDGNYSLSVPAGTKALTFTYIGYVTQTLSIGTTGTINVRLVSDSQMIAEVVVTGYGVAQKRDVGSSSALVTGKQFENLPIQSFDRALQGRAAGVQVTAQSGQPGGAINVRVRGVGSINAGNDPLYIVDGVQLKTTSISGQASSNTLASINPNDIENIEVLKDAAAASIYGAAAANGVVLITTKRGKSGATQVNFSAQQGVMQNIARYDVMNAQQYAQLLVPAAVNAGSTQAAAVAFYGDPSNATAPNTNWFDAIAREGKSRIYDLSLSGGDAKTNFFISGSYTDQDAQVIEAFYKRGTFRGNIGHKISDKLSVNANINLTASKVFGSIADGAFVNSPFYYPFTLRPDVPIYQPDGTYTQGAALKAGFAYNIVQGAKEEVRMGNALQTVSNFSATYKVTPSLSITGFTGIDFVDTRDDNQRPASIPAFAANGGTSSVVNTRNLDWNSNVAANWNKKFGDHALAALVGGELKEQNVESASATGQGFPNPFFRSLQNGTPLSVAGFFTGYKKAGLFSKVNYDYKEKYYVAGTIRYDGSSRFGNAKQYGLFGGISGTWRLSAEDFLKDNKVISDLKARASYGVVGNDQISDFASRALFGAGGSYLGANGIRPSQLGNSNLSWEQAKTLNFGLDYGLFGNRITGSIDVYRRINDNLLLNRPLVSDSGFGSISENIGKVQNEGIELGLNTINLDTKSGIKWNTDFNISFQRNKVLELLQGSDRIGTSFIVGQPVDMIWTYSWAGVNPADGRPMWYDINGNYTYNLIAAQDQTVQGTRFPRFFGGLNNTVSYKNLSLDFLFQFQYGNKSFVSMYQTIWNSGASDDNQLVSQLDEQWLKPGQITAVPRLLNRNAAHPNNLGNPSNALTTSSTRYLFDASYIRLKNITLSYAIPASIASKIKLRNVRVFATGINVLTFTKYPGLDPEIPIGVNDLGNNPQARTYTGGLQIGL